MVRYRHESVSYMRHKVDTATLYHQQFARSSLQKLKCTKMAILSTIPVPHFDLSVVKHLLASISVALLFTFTVRSLSSWYRLRHIPGPLLPSLTNLPRVFWVKTGQSQDYHRKLHDKYGEVVRLGPNMVSISNPEVIPTLYPTRPGFPKVRDFRSDHFLAHLLKTYEMT